MFEKIDELKPKYFVLKADDIKRFLTEEEMYKLQDLSTKISNRRKEERKRDNEYVVLNLDDVFATNYINVKWIDFIYQRMEKHFDTESNEWKDGPFEPATIREIAPMLVNSILSAKYQGLDHRADDKSTVLLTQADLAPS